MSILTNKKILLGVCAGIAAYKAVELVRLLKKKGAQVQVVLTPQAHHFVGELTFQAVSGQAVRSGLLDPQAEAGMGHIELARWPDLIVIAPASANTISKLAHAIADNLLTTLCLARSVPLLIAPAMNQQMWRNALFQNNIATLRQCPDVYFSDPQIGEQACGDNGPGRLAEPESIVRDCEQYLLCLTPSCSQQPAIIEGLQGKRVLITAGPTIEDIDPVRYISNRSSGKMGYAIAQVAQTGGAQVDLISGPVALAPPSQINIYPVRSACDMLHEVMQRVGQADLFIATAAVADYRPEQIIKEKIKKHQQSLNLKLIKNPDILAQVGQLDNKPVCVGFAAETHDLEQYAQSKLIAKKVDMIAANRVGQDQHGQMQGFEADHNALQLFFYNSKGEITSKQLPHTGKMQLARLLLAQIIRQFF